MPNLFLEIARGLAALWVFAFHLLPVIADSSPGGARFAAHGHLGVPLFFVISGYCLYSAAASNLRAGRSPWEFLRRRFMRIFPPFWISILALLVLPFLIEAISALKSGHFVRPHLPWADLGALDWMQFATLTRVFTAQDSELHRVFTVFNAVYWTLAIEFQFYLVMFAVLFAPRWWKQLLVTVCVLSCFSEQIGVPGLFLPYWPSFAVGLGLRWLHERGASANHAFGRRTPVFAGALLALLITAGLASVYHEPVATLLTGLDGRGAMVGFALYAAAILWLGGGIEQAFADRDQGGRAVRWLMRPFLLLGASSYSLYLLHGKLFHLPEQFVRQIVSPANSLYPVLVMAATAALCYLFYLGCEKPFMSTRYRRRLDEELAPGTALPPQSTVPRTVQSGNS